MRTTARLLTVVLAVVLASSIPWPARGQQPGIHSGSSQPSKKTDPRELRRRSDDLLRRARQAMEEGDLDAAGKLLAEAESLGAKYGALEFGDTPAKVRRDLERKIKGQSNRSLLSGLFVPWSHQSKGPRMASDPFQGRPTDSTAGAQLLNDPKTQAKSFLRLGRQLLEQGNLEGAVHYYHRAAAVKASFGPHEDSPERLAADIRKAGGR
ncbi:MAG TPA: hypothetical protein EYP56_16905, partial [Planctomycetaceae bacterium]|nr:hypothetical protein [Planctomycetaceae bacterium]